jgi:XTP/dITP diphosphohydrolase
MSSYCIASNNKHKIEEMSAILGSSFSFLSLEDIGCREELPETQDTLEGNALEKARFVFDRYRIPCFADDTGLEVKALNGEPGVYSARYAGPAREAEANMDLLLENLQDKSERNARFRTVIALIDDQGEHLFEGTVEGTIIDEKRGTGGFGYDPIFKPKGYTQTFGEMPLSEKNQISHRAKAVEKLCEYLKQINRS